MSKADAVEPTRLPLDAPWFDAALGRLADARSRGQLPQSLLIHAHRGAGGIEFARRVGQLLLCERAGPDARTGCGDCRGCERVAIGQHPDAREISPVDSKQIKVEQVRDVLEELALSSYEGRATVVVFAPAEAMNANAANALLKNLEEPRRDAYLILVASQPSLLPATLRSRCLRLSLPAPTLAAALDWLQRHRPSSAWDGALQVLGVEPYEALDVTDPADLVQLRDDTWKTLEDLRRGTLDVVRTAERWGKAADLGWRLRCLENCLTGQTLRNAAGGGKSSELRPAAHLSGPELDINIAIGVQCLDHLAEIRRQLASPLNKALLMEQWLWRLSRATARGS